MKRIKEIEHLHFVSVQGHKSCACVCVCVCVCVCSPYMRNLIQVWQLLHHSKIDASGLYWCFCIWGHFISCGATNCLGLCGQGFNQLIQHLCRRLFAGSCCISLGLLTCLIRMLLLLLVLPLPVRQQVMRQQCMCTILYLLNYIGPSNNIYITVHCHPLCYH